jgi:hypothetical protein
MYTYVRVELIRFAFQQNTPSVQYIKPVLTVPTYLFSNRRVHGPYTFNVSCFYAVDLTSIAHLLVAVIVPLKTVIFCIRQLHLISF